MKLNVAMDSVEEKEQDGRPRTTEEPAYDGDIIIEGDGGTVDSSSKVQIPPPPPPAY
ncbi:MAG TPA: hypothetical protein VF414_15105 [Thermoanaerobaculia bacterium]